MNGTLHFILRLDIPKKKHIILLERIGRGLKMVKSLKRKVMNG